MAGYNDGRPVDKGFKWNELSSNVPTQRRASEKDGRRDGNELQQAEQQSSIRGRRLVRPQLNLSGGDSVGFSQDTAATNRSSAAVQHRSSSLNKQKGKRTPSPTASQHPQSQQQPPVSTIASRPGNPMQQHYDSNQLPPPRPPAPQQPSQRSVSQRAADPESRASTDAGAKETGESIPLKRGQPLTCIGRDIRLTKRLLQHATRLALADNDQQVEVERWNLRQVEQAMREKKSSAVDLQGDPEEYIHRERGWWDRELAGWKDKREKMRQEFERKALEQILAGQSPEQLRELQDPEAAKQWLQLMEASLHPFISELNRNIAADGPPSVPLSPPGLQQVPNESSWHPRESRSGLWSTVPKTTEEYVEARRQNLLRADWCNSFARGETGAHGDPEDRYWKPSQLPPGR
ncbi:hypothetical protein DIPPA_11906, partial [Diplonema papillatum]